MVNLMNESIPAGWYPGTNTTGQYRYWDGLQWTPNVQTISNASAPNAAPDVSNSHTSRRVWIVMLVFPIPALVISFILQVVVRFALAPYSPFIKIVNIVSLLVGMLSVIAIILIPLWIVMLVRSSKQNQ